MGVARGATSRAVQWHRLFVHVVSELEGDAYLTRTLPHMPSCATVTRMRSKSSKSFKSVRVPPRRMRVSIARAGVMAHNKECLYPPALRLGKPEAPHRPPSSMSISPRRFRPRTAPVVRSTAPPQYEALA